MANQDSEGSVLTPLQVRLAAAAGERLRPELTVTAQNIASSVWDAAAPELEENFIRGLRERWKTPPADGRQFRAVIAAHGVTLVEALELMGYWPDLLLGGRARTSQEKLVESATWVGLTIRVVASQGNRIVVELLRP